MAGDPTVIPKFINCGENCQVVAIYPEALSGSVDDEITLIFPGPEWGSAPVRVIPQRVGDSTLVFDTPAYKTLHSSHKTIDVLPILHDHQNSATVELHQFSLVVKNPVKNLIELCLNLSTNEAILPILVTLMLHCNGEQEKSNFQGPQFDRIFSTLIGSRSPGSGVRINDILLPKRVKKSDLTDLCKEYQLSCSEEQVDAVKHRKKIPRYVAERTRRGAIKVYENITKLSDSGLSSSTPNFDSDHNPQHLREKALSVYRVEQGVQALDAQYLTLEVGDEVYVMDSSSDIWYGLCGENCGYFDSRLVRLVKVDNKHQPMDHAFSNRGSESVKKCDQLGKPLLHQHSHYQNIAEMDTDRMFNLPKACSRSVDVNLHMVGIDTPHEEPEIVLLSPKKAPKVPISPLVRRKIKWPLHKHREKTSGITSGDPTAGCVATDKLSYHKDEVTGVQKTSRDYHSGAKQAAEMKPMPRPRTNKSTVDSPDHTQVNDSEESDHEYEDIDKVLNQCAVRGVFTIPPRTISRQEHHSSKIPPKTPPKPAPATQRRLVIPVSPDAALQSELRQKINTENTS